MAIAEIEALVSGGDEQIPVYQVNSTSITFNGNNSYTFAEDYDMVSFSTTSGSPTNYVHSNYLYNGELMSNAPSKIVGSGSYTIYGGILNVKAGDTLKTNTSSFPTSIVMYRNMDK